MVFFSYKNVFFALGAFYRKLYTGYPKLGGD